MKIFLLILATALVAFAVGYWAGSRESRRRRAFLDSVKDPRGR